MCIIYVALFFFEKSKTNACIIQSSVLSLHPQTEKYSVGLVAQLVRATDS